MFIWMAKFGAAYGVRTGIHVGVDRARQYPARGLSPARDLCLACCAGRSSPHRSRLRRRLCRPDVANRPAVQRPRSADVDRLSRDPARLGPDVLPLSAGRMVVLPDRRAAASRCSPRSKASRSMRRRLHPAPASPREVAAQDKASPLGLILILVPILIVAVCFAHAGGLIVLPQGLRAWHRLRAAACADADRHADLDRARAHRAQLHVHAHRCARPNRSSLKLFTGIESFEIMAIPFFILAGNFLTHGGVARRMITFATSMVGHWYGGLALAARAGLRHVCAISGSIAGDGRRDRLGVLPAMVAQGFPMRFGAGVITRSGSLGILIPPSIPMVLFAVSTNVSVGKLFIAGIVPGIALATMLWRHHLVSRLAQRLSAYAESDLDRAPPRLPQVDLGPVADRDRHRRHLQRAVHPDGSRRGERRSMPSSSRSSSTRTLKLRGCAEGAAASANLSAMLLYIITNAVLFSFLMTYENIPHALGTMDDRRRDSAGSASFWSSTYCC